MILIIDDEPQYIKNYNIALEENGFQTKLITDVDEALEFVSTKHADLQAIILDIMMPYGNSFSDEETSGGTRTGNVLYSMIRKKMPQLPVFILTIISDESVKAQFEDDSDCHFFPKRKPFIFAAEVKSLLSGN